MSQSFNDLWASSNPVKSQQPQQRSLVVTSNAPTNVALGATPDAFSMLASCSSRPNSRAITSSKNHTPVSPKNTTASNDAFGGLVSFGNSTSPDGGLTIAERAAQAERERREQIEKDKIAFDAQGSFWDKYEVLTTSEQSIPNAHVKSNDPWDLDFLTQEQTSSSEPLPAPKAAVSSDNSDRWSLDLIDSKPPVDVTTPATVLTTDVFDMDHLNDPLGTFSPSHFTEPPLTKTPGSFDFGDREDQLLGAVDNDILGSLSKPIEGVNGVISKVFNWPCHHLLPHAIVHVL